MKSHGHLDGFVQAKSRCFPEGRSRSDGVGRLRTWRMGSQDVTDTWLITMVNKSKSPKDWVVGPVPNGHENGF